MTEPASYDKIAFSVDLVEACQRELDFLSDVDQHEVLTTRGPAVLRAIRRYEQYWLPLAARHPTEQLVPGLDVHWVWHCHMLAPYSYESDVSRLVGRYTDVMWVSHLCGNGRYVGFVPGRRGVRSEPALYVGLKEQSQVK